MKGVVFMMAAFAAASVRSELRRIEVKEAPFPFAVNEWTPPEREFPITSYGAKPGREPVTVAMDRAIAAAHKAGGGRVVVPPGEWLTGAFKMRSGVALVVGEGATLRFPDDPVVVYRAPLKANGRPTMTQKGLIQADGCTNVAIMGTGTLKADVGYWHRSFMLNPKRGFPRPQFFKFNNCRNVRFEGFKIRGSPAWTMHFSLCRDVVLRNVDSICSGPNTDGIDLESCDTVLVEGCSLDQTDDTYTIKSGFNERGRKRNRPTQNVVIRNCRAVHGHALLAIGSEVSGGVRNIWMTDCSVEGECWNWLYIKTNSKRGAYVENVTMENIRGRRASQAVMNVDMFYDGNPNKELTKKGGQLWCTRIDGVNVRNVVCEEAGRIVRMNADTNLPPVNLSARNIRVGRLRINDGKNPVSIRNVSGMKVENVRIDPSAVGEVLDLPEGVRILDAAGGADFSGDVVFDRGVFEEISENECVRRVLKGRIAAEVSNDRNCAPRVVPSKIDDMPETLEGNRTKRVYRALVDVGCALPGAIVTDGLKRVGLAEASGATSKFPGLKLSVSVSKESGTVKVSFSNGSSVSLKDVWGEVFFAPEWMIRRRMFRIPEMAAGAMIVREFPLGAAAHYLPGPVGMSPYAVHVDFTSAGVRSRLWAMHEAESDALGFTPPNAAAVCAGPADRSVFDDGKLCLASAGGCCLPVLDGAEWRRPAASGAAWYNVTDVSRPYAAEEMKLAQAGRLAEAFAVQFEVPAGVTVKMRFLPWLWDRNAAVFLNGERLALKGKLVTLPVKVGLNRIVARFRSKSGDRKACSQCAIFTWAVPEQLNCVPFALSNSGETRRPEENMVSFPLEWNSSYDTAVAYETEIEPSKIASLSGKERLEFAVSAKGGFGMRDLPVSIMHGRTDKSVRLRFKVPEGTRSLSCAARKVLGTAFDSDPDNLFAGAVNDASKWKLTPRCGAAVLPEGGIVFSAKGFGAPEATLTVPVPDGLAGKPVVLDAVTENVGKESSVRVLRIEQFAADGKKLPESVVDRRWTTHACPPGVEMRYLERGRIHPKAVSLRAFVSISSPEIKRDVYGMPRQKEASMLARHRFSRLSLRPAAELPFPRYDDSFFAPGVSGNGDDCALVLGGKNEKAFWYQTRSHASWSDAVNLRDENLIFFPAKAGTVEAWFKSGWIKRYGKDSSGKTECREYTIFESYQGFRASERRIGGGALIALSYRPDPGVVTACFREPTTRKEWKAEAKMSLPEGQWCHFALQWEPKGTAEVFVDGRKVLSFAIPEWLGCDLKDKSIAKPNDENAQEFFLGSSCRGSRLPIVQPDTYPLVEGAVDLFRASTGKRYASDFVPEKTFRPDSATRALFTFDRTFDGVSGGGLGWIRGTMRALSDRVDHTLSLSDGRRLQYWPGKPLPENDPSVVLDAVNYPNLPTPTDFEMARRPFEHTATLSPGEKLKFDAPEGVVTDFTEIENVSAEPLVLPILVNSGELDPRSFGDIADSLNLSGLSARERANRMFQLVLSATDYYQIHSAKFPPGSDRPRDTEYDCMTMLNGYCGFECGPMNHLTANLFVFAGRCPASETAGYGHQFEQVFFDGKNHIYDLSAQKFFPAWDNETSAYLEEGGDQPGIFHRMGMSCDHFIRMGHRGFWGIGLDRPAKIGITLNPGERFRVWQVNDGNCNDLISDRKTGVYRGGKSDRKQDMDKETHADTEKDYIQRVERFFPHYLNGFISFSGKPEKGNGAFSMITPDSFCYTVDGGGYPITAAYYRATKRDGSQAEIEISTDDGKTFRTIQSPATYAVRARMAYLVRVKASMDEVERFDASTELQLNQRVFPGRIRPGGNEFMLKAVSGGKARVKVAGRVAAARLKVEGKVVHSGTVKGVELLFTAFDSSSVRELSLRGISAAATLRTFGNVNASLSDGKLRLSAKDVKSTAFGAVQICDGGAEKTLTTFAGPGVRFATAADVTVKGAKAKVKAPDATSPQSRVEFTSHCEDTSEAVFNIGPTPAGCYAVFNLNRFISHPEQRAEDGLRMVWPGQKRKSYGCGSPRNISCNYLKANYGKAGERANFKWDYYYRDYKWGLYQSLKTINVPAAETIRMFSWRDDPVEVAAVLVVPNPSKDVRAELIKALCGFNTDPWRIAAAGDGFGTCFRR